MLRLMDRTLALTVVEQTQDQELVKKAREGSHAAFDVLFQRHKPFIYNVCYHMLGSADDAVDATQAAFRPAIRHFQQAAAAEEVGARSPRPYFSFQQHAHASLERCQGS